MKKGITFKEMEVGKRYWDSPKVGPASCLLEFVGFSKDKTLAFFRGIKGPYEFYLTDPHPETGEEVIPFVTFMDALGISGPLWRAEE